MTGKTDPLQAAHTLPLDPAGQATGAYPTSAQAPEGALPSVPNYEILGILGRGGMGVVYRARDLTLNRLVALKMILSGEHAGGEERRRFQAEAEAIAHLSHAFIIEIHRVGEHEGRPFLCLELCTGGSLARRLADPMPPTEAARLVEKLARAIHHAHLAGIVHRDLKPGNILIAGDGSPRITDFGLARRIEDAGNTRTGSLMGTPSYMAPEQARGEKAGPPADIWALGIILYECLTGRPPFRSVEPFDTIMQVIEQEPVPPSRLQGKLPRDLETIVLKCLEKDQARRYPTAEALADDLAAFCDGKPIMARATGPVERAVKWARRRPAIAALSAACAGLFFIGFALVAWAYLDAKAARDDARREYHRAQEALDKAEESLYINSIALADREWSSHNIPRAREVLALCPESLRRWEWGYIDWRCEGGLYSMRGHTGRVIALATWGDRLASGGFDGTIRLWHAHRPGVATVRADGLPRVMGLMFSPDGKRLAAACHDGVVRVYEVNTTRLPVVIRAHEKAAGDVAWSHDGKLLATGGEDGLIKFWDEAGNPAGTLNGHTQLVSKVAFSPKGNWLASASFDGLVILWDLAGKKEINRRDGHDGPVMGLDFHPDGQEIASAGHDGTIRLWTLKGTPAATLRGHRNIVGTVRYSPDGSRLVSASHDRTIRIWDHVTGRQLLALSGHSVAAHAALFNGDGRRVFSAGGEGLVKAWDALREPTAIALEDGIGAVRAVEIGADSRTCASLTADGKVRIRDLVTGMVSRSLSLPGTPLIQLAGAQDGTLVSAALNRSVQVWSKGEKTPRSLGNHQGVVTALAMNREGSLVASLSADETVSIRHASTGTEIKSWRVHDDVPTAAAFVPASERLVTAAKDGKIRLWKARTGILIHETTVPGGEVAALAFSPDGATLAICCGDGIVYLYPARLDADPVAVRGHEGKVLAATFSPDGKRLVTAGEDGVVKLRLASGQEILALRGHEKAVSCIRFSPDGRMIVSGSEDETLRIWPSRHP